MVASTATAKSTAPVAKSAPKGKPATFANTAIISLVPGVVVAKAGNSKIRFACYKTGMSVGAYIQACKDVPALKAVPATARNARADLRWDVDHGYITIK